MSRATCSTPRPIRTTSTVGGSSTSKSVLLRMTGTSRVVASGFDGDVRDHHRSLSAPVQPWADTHDRGTTRRLTSGWEVWKALDINTLWHEADVLSTLNDYCAFQVVGTDDPISPSMWLWGREEMAVWTDPENAVKPAVVCTIDKYDNQIRYRAWDAENVGTWITRKFDQGRPSNSSDRYGRGARVPEFQGVEPHGCGELPFVFVHACPPVRYFETNGIGTPLRKINTELDAMLSDIAEAVQFYARPWLLGRNLAAGFRPIVQAGRVIRLEPDRTVTEIGMAPPEPSLEPLVIPVDTQALWEDLNNQVDHALENYGVPKAAVRMTQQTTASGAAIIQEQMP